MNTISVHPELKSGRTIRIENNLSSANDLVKETSLPIRSRIQCHVYVGGFIANEIFKLKISMINHIHDGSQVFSSSERRDINKMIERVTTAIRVLIRYLSLYLPDVQINR